ncbi:MAG: DUF4124 domain-containing protein [Xanthomonadales bacterium]|nr:DUF4124 domain-containing protein [Xanthomonadales bacterium]
MRIKVIFLLCVLHSAGHCAGIYSWVDDNGVRHFGDHPPADQHADRDPVPAVPSVGTVAPKAPVQVKPRQRPRRRAGPSRGDAVAAAHRREEQCHKARLNLDEVSDRRRAGYRASESRRLDRRERRARANIRFYCS